MSGEVNLALGVSAEYAGMRGNAELEAIYQNVFKRLVSFLYAHPRCPFCWSLSGIQLEYFSKKHPEFISILSQLVGRKQVELLGGGYYEPILSILLPVDRVGQIEHMTTLLRKLVGKRPRGVLLSHGVWDAKIIDSLKNCGMDYVLLDSDLLPRRASFRPFILENTGKTVFALPVYKNTAALVSGIEDASVSCVSNVTAFTKSLLAGEGAPEKKRIAVVMFETSKMLRMLETSRFEEIVAELEKSESVTLTTPSMFFREEISFSPVYIPPVMEGGGGNIYEYLQNRMPLHLLYSRMIQVSILVNQCRGDKNKKQTAREKLWEAQTGIFFCAENRSFPEILKLRRAAYRDLLQAESLARELNGFSNSLVSFDANADGINEYICQFDVYNAFITARGGSVYELDVFKSAVNYADMVFPADFSDALPAAPRKNLFVDRLIGQESDFLAEVDSETGLPLAKYTEAAFESKKKEVRLVSQGVFGRLKQSFSLRKIYAASDHGLQVQYILKNESLLPLEAEFCVESSLSIPARSPEDIKIEAVSTAQNLTVDFLKTCVKIPEVSLVACTDMANQISFLFEANEEAFYSHRPVLVGPESGRAGESGDAFLYGVTGYFSWKVSLMPNMEMEKTINLNIITPRQKRKKSK